MSIQSMTPYFILSGRAREAIAFYERALGANVEALQRFGDVDQSCPAARRDYVMHAQLRASDAIFMLSDGDGEGGPSGGGNVSVALALNDASEAKSIFSALAVSGKVIQPLFDAPWGALFGVVQDQFGISWMLNCSKG